MGPILLLSLLPSPRCWVCNCGHNNDIFHLICYIPFQECVCFFGDRVAQTCLAQAVNLLWAAFTEKVTDIVRGNDLVKPFQPVSYRAMTGQTFQDCKVGASPTAVGVGNELQTAVATSQFCLDLTRWSKLVSLISSSRSGNKPRGAELKKNAE